MPWWEMVSMDLRLQFISEYLSGLFSMTELATDTGSAARRATNGWRGTRPPARARCTIDRDDRMITPRRPRSMSLTRCCGCGTAIRAGGQKAAGDGETRRPDDGLAESIDGLRPAAATRRGRAAPPPTGGAARAAQAGPHYRAECDVDHRFQGRVPHGRPGVLLSVDAARRVQPLCVAV